MSDNQVRMNFNTSRELKHRAMSVFPKLFNMDKKDEGFAKIFELGVIEAEKKLKEEKR